MSDVLVLVPAHGEPVALTRAAWNATVDFLADHQAFHESLLEAWRRAPGVTVSDLQATRMAGLADHEADDPYTAAEDRDGLTRLARFCRDERRLPRRRPGGDAGAGAATRARAGARRCGPTGRCRQPTTRWSRRLAAAGRRILGPFAVVLIFLVKWIAKLKILLIALPKLGFLKIAFVGLSTSASTRCSGAGRSPRS